MHITPFRLSYLLLGILSSNITMVNAEAIAEADVTATLNITDINNITTPANATNMSVGDGQQLLASSVSAAVSGFSETLISPIGNINLINSSLTDSFEVAFSVSFTLSVLASLTDILLEDSLALATLVIFDDTLDIDIFNQIEAASGSAIPFDSITKNINFFLSLDPDSSNQLSFNVTAEANTEATSEPEPSAIALLAMGLPLFIGLQKRRLIADTII